MLTQVRPDGGGDIGALYVPLRYPRRERAATHALFPRLPPLQTHPFAATGILYYM